MANAESDTPATATAPANPDRRAWLFRWLTYATGAAASAILGIPVVGYLLGALRKHRVDWVILGPTSHFPLNETRLSTFQNPLGQPWDGMVAHTGVYVRNEGKETFSWEDLVNAMTSIEAGTAVGVRYIDGSLCALGGFTPYPVMSAVKFFPEDFGVR